jgi:hypothetical protein
MDMCLSCAHYRGNTCIKACVCRFPTTHMPLLYASDPAGPVRCCWASTAGPCSLPCQQVHPRCSPLPPAGASLHSQQQHCSRHAVCATCCLTMTLQMQQVVTAAGPKMQGVRIQVQMIRMITRKISRGGSGSRSAAVCCHRCLTHTAVEAGAVVGAGAEGGAEAAGAVGQAA